MNAPRSSSQTTQPRDGRPEEVARVGGELEQQPRLGAGRQRRLAQPRGGASSTASIAARSSCSAVAVT